MALSNSMQQAATLQLTGSGTQIRPTVTQLQDGDYVVAWLQPGANNELDIHAQRFQSDGGRVNIEFALNDLPLGNAFYSDVEVTGLASGGFVVNWAAAPPGGSASEQMHYARFFDSQGNALGPSTAVSDHAAGNLHGNATAALAGGGFVTGWIENPSGSQYNFVLQAYDGAGNKLGANTEAAVAQPTTNGSTYPAAVTFAPTPDGGFYAVWVAYSYGSDPGSPNTAVNIERFDSFGRYLGGPVRLLTAGSNQLIDDISAAVQPGTGGVVIEAQGHLTDNSTYLLTQRFDASGRALSDSQYTFPGSSARALHPELVMFADGSWQTTWSELDFSTSGNNSNVYQRAYDAAGQPLGAVGTSMWSTFSSTQPHDVVPTWDGGMVLAAEVDKFDSAHDIWEQRIFGAPTATREVTGSASIDTVSFAAPREWYGILREGDTITVQGPTDTAILHGVERLSFEGLNVAFDIEGHAGEAYRLYQAAFDRTPDLPGLGFHIHDLDRGVSETDVAAHFTASPEFQAKYGSPDNTAYVTQLYENVLHRAPDSQGLAFHLHDLDNGVTRAQVLVHFAESPENQAQVIGAIDNGIAYVA